MINREGLNGWNRSFLPAGGILHSETPCHFLRTIIMGRESIKIPKPEFATRRTGITFSIFVYVCPSSNSGHLASVINLSEVFNRLRSTWEYVLVRDEGRVTYRLEWTGKKCERGINCKDERCVGPHLQNRS
jgi:hypothetical protein